MKGWFYFAGCTHAHYFDPSCGGLSVCGTDPEGRELLSRSPIDRTPKIMCEGCARRLVHSNTQPPRPVFDQAEMDLIANGRAPRPEVFDGGWQTPRRTRRPRRR